MMDPAIDEPVAPRTPNKPLFPVTPDPLDARLAALEAVAEAAEAYTLARMEIDGDDDVAGREAAGRAFWRLDDAVYCLRALGAGGEA